jgi:hypothetical protein
MPTTKTTSKPAAKRRGRPSLQEGEETVPVTIRMTPPQKGKLARLGGPDWVRAKIDKAPEPKD